MDNRAEHLYVVLLQSVATTVVSVRYSITISPLWTQEVRSCAPVHTADSSVTTWCVRLDSDTRLVDQILRQDKAYAEIRT